ncbi:MAG: ABC transporter permease [Kineosporiaceae bacterium]|nr:ABC transporter permease [Kineosporiaceae bacterium]
MSTTTETHAETVAPTPTLGTMIGDYLAKVRGGDVGALPAVLGFLVLVALFSAMKPALFPTAYNAANLLQQSAGVIYIAMGLVFILLLGEIDLGAGYTAGTSAAIMGVLMTKQGYPWPVAVIGCLVTGAVIGVVVGLLVAKLGIPSFVVTLSTFLGLQGVMLWIIGNGGTISIKNETILAIQNKNLPVLWGWVIFILAVALYAGAGWLGRLRRAKAGLPVEPMAAFAAKLGVMVVILGLATWILNVERSRNPGVTSLKGIPIIVPITAILVVVLTFLLQRTKFGRHIYAVGGNAEAARRAGINVNQVKIVCFVLGSLLAALGGIVLASRENSISPTTGGSTTLLLAVGAAVIGGTSLFGGKGRILDAIIGGLVIAVLNNGMPLITDKAAYQYIVTALVLLLAASVDAISRRRAAATGR